MSFSPFSLLFFILKRHAIRKAGAVVLLLCMTLLMAEFKGYGQSTWEKLKLPKLPEPPPIHEQTGGGAQPTPFRCRTACRAINGAAGGRHRRNNVHAIGKHVGDIA